MNFESDKVMSRTFFLSVKLVRNLSLNIFLRFSQKLAGNSILINSEVFFKKMCWPQTESGCIIDPEIGKRFPGHFRFGIIK